MHAVQTIMPLQDSTDIRNVWFSCTEAKLEQEINYQILTDAALVQFQVT
jgi:hypothetical protein